MRHIEYFRKVVSEGSLGHAYLFTGNDRDGMLETAIGLVQMLSCSGPCMECRACNSISNNSFPDLLLVEPEGGKSISISQVRSVFDHLRFEPYEGDYKFVVVKDVQDMRSDAQSAFLKLLEEPNGRSIIILLSDHPSGVLDTIRSRAHKLPFYRFHTSNDIVNRVNNDKGKGLADLASSSIADRIRYAKDLGSSKSDTLEVLQQWMEGTRIVLLERMYTKGLDGKAIELKKLLSLIQKMSYTVSSTTVSPRVALERILFSL